MVTISGTAIDPEGDSYVCDWTCSWEGGDENDYGCTFDEALEEDSYTCTLVVTDECGTSSTSDDVSITIHPEPNDEPYAIHDDVTATLPIDCVFGGYISVPLDGCASTDPDGNEEITYFEWSSNSILVTGTDCNSQVELGLETGELDRDGCHQHFIYDKHIKCSPSRAQRIVHSKYPTVIDERPQFDWRPEADNAWTDEMRAKWKKVYTEAWIRLQ